MSNNKSIWKLLREMPPLLAAYFIGGAVLFVFLAGYPFVKMVFDGVIK